MINLIILIVFTSLLVLGWTIVSQENMLLHSVRVWGESKNKKWLEPLILCHWCQPSVWSLFGYFFAISSGTVHFYYKLLWLYPLVVCGSSVVCGMVWAAYLVMNREKEFYESFTEEEYE